MKSISQLQMIELIRRHYPNFYGLSASAISESEPEQLIQVQFFDPTLADDPDKEILDRLKQYFTDHGAWICCNLNSGYKKLAYSVDSRYELFDFITNYCKNSGYAFFTGDTLLIAAESGRLVVMDHDGGFVVVDPKTSTNKL